MKTGTVDPVDSSTWDLPEAAQPEHPDIEAVRQRGMQPPAKGLKPAPTPSIQPPQVGRSLTVGGPRDLARDIAYLHPRMGRFLPPAVLLSLADDDMTPEDKDRIVHELARRYDFAPSVYGLEPVRVDDTRGGTGTSLVGYSAEGTMLTVKRARNLMRAHEEDTLRSLIDQITGEDGTVKPIESRVHYPSPTSGDVLGIASVLMASSEMGDASLLETLGTAIQIASAIGGGAGKFRDNLAAFANESLPWAAKVALAEQATADGLALTNAAQAYEKYGMPTKTGGISPENYRNVVLKASAQNGNSRIFNDQLYIYNVADKAWEALSPEDEAKVNQWQIGMPNAILSTTPPSEWLPPETANVPGFSGVGYVNPMNKLKLSDQLYLAQIQLAGLSMFAPAVDGRSQDYYSQARSIAKDLSLEREVWGKSPLGRTVGSVIDFANWGYNQAWAAAMRGFTYASSPFVAAAEIAKYGFDEGLGITGSYIYDMNSQARAVSAGETGASVIAATNVARGLHLPDWTVPIMAITADLVTAGYVDPLIIGGRGLSLLRGLNTVADIGGDTRFVQRALRYLGDEGTGSRLAYQLSRERAFPVGLRDLDALNDAALRLDDLLGVPLLGKYLDKAERARMVAAGVPGEEILRAEKAARYKAFVNMFVDRPRWWLSDKTIPEHLVASFDETDKVAFWRNANGKMKGLFKREAFTPDLTDRLWKVIKVLKKGGAPEEEIISKVRDVMMSGLGAKTLDRQFFRDLVYVSKDEVVYEGPAGRIVQPRSTPREGFATWDEVKTYDRSLGAEFNARRGIPPKVIDVHLEQTGWNIDDVLADIQNLENRFTPVTGTGAESFIDVLGSQVPRNTRFAGEVYGIAQFEIPRFSAARALKSRLLYGEAADTELGRTWRALLNHVPEAEIQFEAGKFEENVRRRLVRSRVFSQTEMDAITQRANQIVSRTNPTRERDMIAFIEDLSNTTFHRISESKGIPRELSDELLAVFNDGAKTDKVNADKARAFGIIPKRDEAGKIVFEAVGDRPLGTTQLMNSWFSPDPLAQRRFLRGVTGDWNAAMQTYRRVLTEAGLSRALPEEITTSTARMGFHSALDSALGAVGVDAKSIQVYKQQWDDIATALLEHRSDRFQTADDVFDYIKVQLGSDPEAIRHALFQIHHEDLARLYDSVDNGIDFNLSEMLRGANASYGQEMLDNVALEHRAINPNLTRVDSPDDIVFVWHENGQVQGYRQIPFDGEPVMVVNPAARGNGIARQLFTESVHDLGLDESADVLLRHLSGRTYSQGGAASVKAGLRGLVAEGERVPLEDTFARISAYDSRLGSGVDQIGRGTRDMESFLAKVQGGEVMGATQFGPDEALMSFFKSADSSTLVHEAGHVLRQLLPDDDLRIIADELGVEFGDLGAIFDRGYKGTFGRGAQTARSRAAVAAEEKFAEMVETYFREGVAPERVRPILDRIKEFLAKTWNRLKGRGATSDVPAGTRAILERYFGAPQREVRFAEGQRLLTAGDLNMGGAEGWHTATKYASKVATQSAQTYIKFWKPWQVLRPAYILRVPLLDEQIRFLTEFGVSGRLQAGKRVGKALSWLDEDGKWSTVERVVATRDGRGLVVRQQMPGQLATEAYANTEATALDAYATVAEQTKAIVNNRELVRSFGEVAPLDSKIPGRFQQGRSLAKRTEADYTAAAETALNGHISESRHGFMALQDVANGTPEDQSVARIVDYFTNDPVGVGDRVRIGIPIDEIPDFADEYVKMVRRYTMSDPAIADAAMHRQFAASMLKDRIETLKTSANEFLNKSRSLEPLEPKVLHMDAQEFADFSERLRIHIRQNDGASFDPTSGKPSVATGHTVGILDQTAHRFSVNALEDPKVFQAELQKFLDRGDVKDALNHYDDLVIGAWVEDGEVHLDPSLVVKDFDQAMGVSLLRNQEGMGVLKAGEYADFIPTLERPTFHGLKSDVMSSQRTDPYTPIVNGLSKWILQEPTNSLSRQPFFKAWYSKMIDAQLALAEEAGVIPANAEMAQRFVKTLEANARRFALDRTSQIMFNIRDQSRLSEMAWFAAPFTQPFFEAFTVYGNLLRRNPALVGWVHRVFQDSMKSGFFKEDENGQVVVPLTNWLGIGPLMRAVSHLPLNFSMPLTSLNMFAQNAIPLSSGLTGNVGLPFPGFSPPALWLMQKMVSDESSSRIASWLFQYGEVGLDDVLPIPTWMRNALQSVTNGGLDEQGYTAYVDSFMQMNQFSGIKFKNADEAVKMAESQAKVFYRWKTVISLLFPGAPTTEFPGQELRTEYQELIDTKGPLEARDIFLKRHPDMWLFVIPKTMWEQADPNLPEGFPTVPVPANAVSDAILNSPGFSEFAASNPWWAWSILPASAFSTDTEFDPDIFRKHLASAQRRYLTPTEYYSKGQAAAGWNAYWSIQEWWNAKQEFLVGQNISETDPEFLAAKAQKDEAQTRLFRDFPAFANAFGSDFGTSDPRPLLYARELAKDKFFRQFPMGKALGDYLKLRDGLQVQMEDLGISSMETKAAQTSGLLATYTDGVATIAKEVLGFQQVYDIFFRNDLTFGIENPAVAEFDSLSPAEQGEALGWRSRYNGIQDELRVAPDDVTRAGLYTEENRLVNSAYTDYAFNPMLVWWAGQDYTRRQEVTERASMKPYLFLNRFERQTVLGESTSDLAETTWEQYNAYREQAPAVNAGSYYEQLNAWMRSKAATDSALAQQIEHADTWGYVFWQQNPYASATGQVGDAWRNLRDVAWDIMDQARKLGLHGGKYDEQYAQAKTYLTDMVKTYLKELPTFKNQWDHFEALSSSDLVDTIMPASDYPIGAPND